MSPAEMQPHELMQCLTGFLEREGIVYRVVGSMASMAYGEPRFTNDIDIVADLSPANLPALIAAFPAPEFYVSEAAALEAIRFRRQFNIIHIPSGMKLDVILPSGSPFSRSELSRGRRFTGVGEFAAWFASPEDVLLNKLVYHQLGGSEKHLRDIDGILVVSGDEIDWDYVEFWSRELGVAEEWRMVRERRRPEPLGTTKPPE